MTNIDAKTTPLTLQWLNIELASNCNLRCKWCSLDHDKPRQYMTRELLAKVLSEVIEDDGFRLDRIELHNAGETLLHPDIAGMLAVIESYKAHLPTINLLTNAGTLNEQRIDTVIDSGAVDVIRFSIDGGTAGEFEEMRRPARWEQIRGNVHRFLDAKEQRAPGIKTGVICIVDPQKELTTAWMEPEFRELFERIDDVSLRYPHNWDGSEDLGVDDRDYRSHAANSQGKLCYFLVKDMVVLPNGETTVCCADLNGRGVIGNASVSTLREIYHAPKRQEMLELFAAGRKSDIELCRSCTGFYE